MEAKHLWNRFRNGDKAAFSTIFKSYYMDLKAYGIKLAQNEILAQEAIQSLFIKLWVKKQTIGEVAAIKSYLIKAYRHTLLDLLQAEKKYITPNSLPISTFQISPQELFIFQQEQKEKAKLLATLLNQLPEKQREIIYLRFYNHLSYIEIAEVMDLQYQTVRNYGVKAMQFLSKNKDLVTRKE